MQSAIGSAQNFIFVDDSKEIILQSVIRRRWRECLKAQVTIMLVGQQTQTKAHAEYFERFSKERTEFAVGSLVLVDYGDNRPNSKLHTYNRGPYRVVHIISQIPPKLHGVPIGKIFFNIKYVEKPASNEILHGYFTKIKAVSLIPAKYKWGRDGPPTTD